MWIYTFSPVSIILAIENTGVKSKGATERRQIVTIQHERILRERCCLSHLHLPINFQMSKPTPA